MDLKKYNELQDLFLNTYGEDNEIRMCIEEMSELTKELCKYMRYLREPDGPEKQQKLRDVKACVVEETADTLNCVNQMKRVFGSLEVEKVMAEKMLREEQRIKERR